MKKEYIAPMLKESKVRYYKQICLESTSQHGIRPQQDWDDRSYDNIDGGAENPDDQAAKYRGFGSDSGPWESLW